MTGNLFPNRILEELPTIRQPERTRLSGENSTASSGIYSVMCYEQGCHPRFIHANADAVARYAGLCYFKCRITNAVAIANADLVIRKSLNSEVFSELAEDEVTTCENALPVVIGVHLINKNGALLPTMTGEIGLGVANKIELADHWSSLNWTFPDRGTDSLTVPCHVAWKTDILRRHRSPQ